MSLNTKEPIIVVDVILDNFSKFEADNFFVQQISFHGTFHCDYGKGVIMPGGVDTQMQVGNDPYTLSARYILEGEDTTGKVFHIYIENNGIMTGSEITETTPIIYTDYEKYKYLEHAKLRGTVNPAENGVQIQIYEVS